MDRSPAAVIILAAGAGTRMKSATPKVLNSIAGRSLLGHAVVAGRKVGARRVVVVVRHERDRVVEDARRYGEDILFADQDEIPGTGRAVQCALEALAREGESFDGPILVTAADTPLLDGETLSALVRNHLQDGNAMTLLTTVLRNPTGYGRIVREGDDVVGIVEEKDASDEQRKITEVNAGVYAFDGEILAETLGAVGTDNAQREVYLTDVIGIAHERGRRVQSIVVDDSLSVEGANDKAQLAVLAREMNARIVKKWMHEGVTVVDPATTWIDVDVELAPDVVILPGVQLHGACRIESFARIGPDTTLTDCEVGEGAQVIRSHGELAIVRAGATVGPFAYMRPGTDLGEKGKIGTFVETKNAVIGKESKVPHLSYVGDATIGVDTNIGAASVFVNYDGITKHRTIVGDHCRMGSDNMYVAPLNIGDGAYSGAGTTLRRDVPPGALAINPSTQRNIDGWVEEHRPGTAAAEAAARAKEGAEDAEGGAQ